MSIRKIAAGNWKMNMNYKEAGLLLDQLQSVGSFPDGVEVIIAPPAVFLSEFAMKVNADSNIKLAAQNVHFMPNGAFTGEISASMLSSLSIEFCLVGHSERRQMFGESDEIVSKKVKILCDHGINPIICVGEMLEHRYADKHFEIVGEQIKRALSAIEQFQVSSVIIAYEPVWAIGTGQTASTEQVREMHQFIRELLVEVYQEATGTKIPLLYGGSCNASNATELFDLKDVNGGLIGGASLKESDFLKIIHSF